MPGISGISAAGRLGSLQSASLRMLLESSGGLCGAGSYIRVSILLAISVPTRTLYYDHDYYQYLFLCQSRL